MKDPSSSNPRTTPSVPRRTFLASAATATAGFTIVPRHVLGGQGTPAPSDKLNIAGVGVGGMGKTNLKRCEAENIVALCDVDSDQAAEVFEKYPGARRYKDFRVMLDEQSDIDAVIMGWGGGGAVIPPDLYQIWHSSQAIQGGSFSRCLASF